MHWSQYPHKRHNPLTGEWIKVSPQRTKRPWQGQVEKPAQDSLPAYDPDCYLCPGNTRSGGAGNPSYEKTFAFDNDFSALLMDIPGGIAVSEGPGGMIQSQSERGVCRVLCFSPRHDLTLARMDHDQIIRVVELWRDEYAHLISRDHIAHVQIFENKGAVMGCSNPHPHGQVWADEHIPVIPAEELKRQQSYVTAHRFPLLMDYLSWERDRQERLVYANESFTVLVPFWAVWPFETMILPNRQVSSLPELTSHESYALADALRALCIRYDNLFSASFPYSMGIHQAPADSIPHQGCTLHLHYYPPLLRSAAVKKFMVGYEMLAMPQRDITPEQSARRLRECSGVHYSREQS